MLTAASASDGLQTIASNVVEASDIRTRTRASVSKSSGTLTASVRRVVVSVLARFTSSVGVVQRKASPPPAVSHVLKATMAPLTRLNQPTSRL